MAHGERRDTRKRADRTEARADRPRRRIATPEARSKWQATNAARERLEALAGTDGKGRLDITALDWTAHFRAGPTTPRRVVQFWDRNPPDQILTLMRRVEEVCRETGYEHVAYDLEGARARLAATDAAWVDAFDGAFHPSMQADILRVVELAHHGGIYIDADMTLSRPLPFAPPPVPLFAQWAHGSRTNVANWFLCAPPGDPVLRAILQRMARKLAQAPREADGRFVKQSLLGLTGPVMLSRALERHIRADADARDVAVMPVRWCHSFVEPARRFLQAKVEYKSSGLHWRRAAEGSTG